MTWWYILLAATFVLACMFATALVDIFLNLIRWILDK